MVRLTTKLSLADEDLNYGDVYYTVFPLPRRAAARWMRGSPKRLNY